MTETATIVVQDESIGTLVMQRDAQLVQAITSTRDALGDYLELAEKTTLARPEDKQTATELINSVKALCLPIVEMIAPIKKQANEQVDKILSIEKLFQTYVPPAQVAKALADERYLAIKVIHTMTRKLNDYLDYEEDMRRKEEARLQAQAEKERQKELDRIAKKLDGLMDKTSNLTEKVKLLEAQLEDQTITVEEAEIIRRRIEALDVKLRSAQDKVTDSQIKLEEVAIPVSVTLEKRKVNGLSETHFWDVAEIINARLLHKEIAEGRLNPGVCMGFSFAKLRTYANDQVKGTNQAPVIPGVRFEKKRKVTVSKGRG